VPKLEEIEEPELGGDPIPKLLMALVMLLSDLLLLNMLKLELEPVLFNFA
jgi:hypothetical protein